MPEILWGLGAEGVVASSGAGIPNGLDGCTAPCRPALSPKGFPASFSSRLFPHGVALLLPALEVPRHIHRLIQRERPGFEHHSFRSELLQGAHVLIVKAD